MHPLFFYKETMQLIYRCIDNRYAITSKIQLFKLCTKAHAPLLSQNWLVRQYIPRRVFFPLYSRHEVI